MNLKKYLPWAIAFGAVTWMFCPYFKRKEEEGEVTSGEESLEAVDKAIKRMG